MENLSEDLIFETYRHTLTHAGEYEFMQFDDFSKESFYRLKFRSIDSRIQNMEPNSLFKEDVAPQEKIKADIEEIKASSTDFKVSKVTED